MSSSILLTTATQVSVQHAWFDSSRAPLYRWTFPECFSDEELEQAIAAHRAWRELALYDSAFVIDISMIREVTARQRWIVAGHLRDAADHAKRHVVATVMVVPGALHRALMTTVFWIQRPPTPVHVVRTLDEAVDHCESRLGFPAHRGESR